jgi:hypothetical protein
MKLAGISDFTIDETEIGFADNPLSNDNGSEILGCVGIDVVVVGGGTAADVISDSVFLSFAFFDDFVLTAGERPVSLSSSCILSFKMKNGCLSSLNKI